jgi:hypothetical protein
MRYSAIHPCFDASSGYGRTATFIHGHANSIRASLSVVTSKRIWGAKTGSRHGIALESSRTTHPGTLVNGDAPIGGKIAHESILTIDIFRAIIGNGVAQAIVWVAFLGRWAANERILECEMTIEWSMCC